jgi:hypothetical protein
MKGYIIGILEIALFFVGSIFVRKSFHQLQDINKATYFWVMLTILTGIWEVSYLLDYQDVTIYAHQLVNNSEHVWTNNYDITYVLPWKLSYIFYSEYGAWADREYMSNSDDWSKVIEGSHCTQCALFSFLAIMFKIFKNHNNFLICLSVAMGTQFMNSFLYMFAYFWQEREISNVNYPTEDFPSDVWLFKRAFMWVNIFWLVMPFYTIMYYILQNWKINENVEKKKVVL